MNTSGYCQWLICLCKWVHVSKYRPVLLVQLRGFQEEVRSERGQEILQAECNQLASHGALKCFLQTSHKCVLTPVLTPCCRSTLVQSQAAICQTQINNTCRASLYTLAKTPSTQCAPHMESVLHPRVLVKCRLFAASRGQATGAPSMVGRHPGMEPCGPLALACETWTLNPWKRLQRFALEAPSRSIQRISYPWGSLLPVSLTHFHSSQTILGPAGTPLGVLTGTHLVYMTYIGIHVHQPFGRVFSLLASR